MNPYPRILSLMRHGNSAENVVFNHEGGGYDAEHPKFADVTSVPTWLRPLSREGRAQAQRAGRWFDTYREAQRDPLPLHGYASHYVRARETAGIMDLGVLWKLDVRISERNWGMETFLRESELREHYPHSDRFREHDKLLWAPVGGDSMQLAMMYIHDFLGTLARDHSGDEVLVVTHGEAMYGFQYLLEHWLPEELTEAMNGRRTGSPYLTNCMVIQYTRIDEDGVEHPHYVRKRFVDPIGGDVDPELRALRVRRAFAGHELLEQIKYLERHV